VEKPIAIFDRKRDKIVYLEDLLVCRPFAIITTRLEFRTTEGRVVALDKLVDQELFAVGQNEMIEIMKEIDHKYSAAYTLAFESEARVPE
jgi:hypothetical protein